MSRLSLALILLLPMSLVGCAENQEGMDTEDQEARALQAHGFPTLLLRTGNSMAAVTRGYRPFEDVEPHLTAYLAERYDAAQFLS